MVGTCYEEEEEVPVSAERPGVGEYLILADKCLEGGGSCVTFIYVPLSRLLALVLLVRAIYCINTYLP